MTPVRWTEQAVEDLRRIREFIGRDSPRYGRLVAERLYDATSRPEAFPRSGRVVPEVDRDEIRELIVGDYRIVYRLEARGACGRPRHTAPSYRPASVGAPALASADAGSFRSG